jgi:cell wall-associated NlpC family hydrolase
MDAWRIRVVEEAEKWLATPWMHNQGILGAGVDCARFLKAVYVGAGLVEDFDLGPYSSDFMLHRSEELFLAGIDRHMVRTGTPMPGDVAIWKFGHCYSHGGIVVAWPIIIHAYARERCVTWGDASKPELAHREPLFYTLPGADHGV